MVYTPDDILMAQAGHVTQERTEAMPSKNSVMVRIPKQLKARLDKLAADYMAAYEKGQTTKVAPVEQGAKGSWVSLSQVIELALDEVENHKARSKKSAAKRKKSATVTVEVEKVECP